MSTVSKTVNPGSNPGSPVSRTGYAYLFRSFGDRDPAAGRDYVDYDFTLASGRLQGHPLPAEAGTAACRAFSPLASVGRAPIASSSRPTAASPAASAAPSG